DAHTFPRPGVTSWTVTFQPRATSQRATNSTARPSSRVVEGMASNSAASATTSVMPKVTGGTACVVVALRQNLPLSTEVDRPASRALRLGKIGSVHDHTHLLQRDQSAADHLVESRQDTLDAFMRIHAFDDDRQVAAQPKDRAPVHDGGRSETEHAAKRCGSREMLLSQQFDDGLIERPVLPTVVGADMDPHERAFALESLRHGIPSGSFFAECARYTITAARSSVIRPPPIMPSSSGRTSWMRSSWSTHSITTGMSSD